MNYSKIKYLTSQLETMERAMNITRENIKYVKEGQPSIIGLQKTYRPDKDDADEDVIGVINELTEQLETETKITETIKPLVQNQLILLQSKLSKKRIELERELKNQINE